MTIASMLIPGLLLMLTAQVGRSSQVDESTLNDIGFGPDTTYASQQSEGAVTLEVTPRWQEGILTFEFRANTHSVDLSAVRLLDQVKLIVNETPLSPAEAGDLTGHHATASVVFLLDQRPAAFGLEIRDVPDVAVRRMTWP